MKKAYFPMYHSYLKKCANLSDSELGRLVRALLQYSIDGSKPNLNGRESGVFDFIAYDIDEAAESYAEMCEKQREKINNRWNKKNTNDTAVYNGIPVNTNDTTVYNGIPVNTGDTKQKQKQKQKLNNNERTPSKPPTGDADERFAEFWQAYPRKVGKGEAAKIWKRLHVSQELLQKMLIAIENAKHTEQWQKENGSFIPNPATWLRQTRWEDGEESEPFDEENPYADWAVKAHENGD